MKIDRELLNNDCFRNVSDDNAYLVYEKLGPLSNWWMQKDVFQRAANDRRFDQSDVDSLELSDKPGSCWPIFAMEKPPQSLREAMLLPCVWKQGTVDGGLPNKLSELASLVAKAIQDSKIGTDYADPAYFSLHLDRRIARVELDDSVFVASGSAWVTLAGGLVSAMSGLRVVTNVWWSAAIDVRAGAMRVGLLEKKMALAGRVAL